MSNFLVAQSFNFVNGGTGMSTGGGVTIDENERTYVVGSFNTAVPDSFGLPLILKPSYNSINGGDVAYLSRYESETGKPEKVALINIDTNKTDYSSCPTVTMDSYVMADRVALSSTGKIYVLGVFAGCNLNLFDATGISRLVTNSQHVGDTGQKAFVAIYDTNFRPLGCFIYATDPLSSSIYTADIKCAKQGFDTIQNFDESVFFALSFSGNHLNVEAFGLADTSTTTTLGNIFPDVPHTYDILIGQIEDASMTMVDKEVIGGDGDDHASALASGYLGEELGNSNLYMTGAFENEIKFNHPDSASGDVHSSSGRYDLFACKFPNYSLDTQYAVSSGGPGDDQALAITDNGKYIGGFISDSAKFDTTLTYYNLNPTSPCGSYGGNDRRQFGFIAQPDYINKTWVSVDTVSDTGEDSQVMTMASGRCNNFYAVFSTGLHRDMVRIPWLNYNEPDFLSSGTCLNYFSTLTKWRDYGPQADMVWQHSFSPANPTAYPAAATRYIEDIEVAIGDQELIANFDVGMDATDLVFTGRFGDSINVPNPLYGNSSFNGNWQVNYQHSDVGMFVIGMSQLPRFSIDSLEVCITDTVNLSMNIAQSWYTPSFGMPPQIDLDSIYYTGPGIIDSVNLIFRADTFGNHYITGHVDYMGCKIKGQAYNIEVYAQEFYPRQVIHSGTDWSEGLAAEGMNYDQIQQFGDTNFTNKYPGPFAMYLLGGRYFEEISFDMINGTTETFTTATGTEGGFIAAYGPCGVYWAVNIDPDDDGYIEHLQIDDQYSPTDGLYPSLFAVGGVEGSTEIVHSDSGTVTLDAVNPSSNPQTLSGIGTGIEKGLVMRLHPLSGEVEWIYLGGDDGNNEENRFHGMDYEHPYLAVVGERSTDFSYNDNNTSIGVTNGGEDPIVILMDSGGAVISVNSGTNGFGTANDDHGDAVDIASDGTQFALVSTGYINEGGAGTWQPSQYNLNFGTSPIPAGDGSNIYVARDNYNVSSGVWQHDRVRVFEGEGDDFAHDILITSIFDTSSFYPDQFIVCGAYSDSFKTAMPTGTMVWTSGVTDYDAYFISLDNSLNVNWFDVEGRSATNSSESANALTRIGTSIFGYGKQQGINNRSRWFGSGGGITTPSLLGGSGNISGYHNLFTVEFDAPGSLIDTNFAVSENVGQNEGRDITRTDSALIVAATMKVSSGQRIFFREANGVDNHHILSQVNGPSTAVVGRQKAIDLRYYKKSKNDADSTKDGHNLNELVIYPNPSNGHISLAFRDEMEGELQIIDYTGKTVFTKSFRNSKNLDLTLQLSSGLYVVRVDNADGSYYGKFVVH